jgi:hypothetical protein
MPTRSISTALLLGTLVSVATARIGAQSAAPAPAHPVLPGARELRMPAVREGTDTLTLVMEKNGVALPVGILVVETRRVSGPGGVAALSRVEVTTSRMMAASVDTFVVALATLAPLSQRTHEERAVALDNDGRHVSGTIAEGQASGRVDVTVATPVFYDHSMDLVLGALPLVEGYEADLPVYDDEAGAVAWRHLRVAGTDRLPGEGELVDAWRVETSRGRVRSTYWIDKATRRMLRWALPLSSGGELRIVR